MNGSATNYECLGVACALSSLAGCLLTAICTLGVVLGLWLSSSDGESAHGEQTTGPSHTATDLFPPPDISLTARTSSLVPPPVSTSNGQLHVHFMDVDQGDSVLIQAPDGATALIDGGYGNSMALAYLRQQGITRIDVMIATHPHADHIGGLVQVMQAMPMGEIWTNGAIHTTDIFERFIDTITEQQIPYYEASAGTQIRVGSLELTTLYSYLICDYNCQPYSSRATGECQQHYRCDGGLEWRRSENSRLLCRKHGCFLHHQYVQPHQQCRLGIHLVRFVQPTRHCRPLGWLHP